MAKKRAMRPPTNVAGYDPRATAGECTWDAEAAQRVCEFFPEMLSHTKGYSGPFKLEKWQRDWLATLFGWKRPDGTRRYREAFTAVPRKNGKTAMSAGIALYCLLCDGERGAEVYCAAYSRDQATLVFEPAATMVRANPYLRSRTRIVDSTKRIVAESSGSFCRAIPADAANTHGFNASAVIFDELHTQSSRDLYDVLKTSQGARSQPLFASITTAGHDRHSVCWEVWDYARKVRDGIVEDPYFLPMIYELQEGDDWKNPKLWKKLNPNYGVSVSVEYLQEAFDRALATPAYENTFRNLHLNEWTEQAIRWISMERWDNCGGELPSHDGQTCWGGLDLSSTTDISALILAFPNDDTVELECRFWIPEETIHERAHRDRVPYPQWAHESWITTTPGNSVDYDFIRADINKLGERYHIRQIAIDRWNATQLAQQLDGDGFDVGMFGQGFASMSSPSKDLERLVVDSKLRHGSNPVLRWMASNVAIQMDAAGNIKPSKEKSTERIDGIVATIMALGCWAANPDTVEGSLFVC